MKPGPRPALDVLYGYAGPCLFCGYPDKRHRLADAIVGMIRAGDSPQLVVDAYDWPEVVTLDSIAALMAHADLRRRQHKERWS